jgi:CRP/FNR family transcriptional regulator, cyclic AMP receptor protein
VSNDQTASSKPSQKELLIMLAQSPWFSGLPKPVQAELLPKLHHRRFSAGETLYHQGAKEAGLWGILQGSVHSIGTARDGSRALLSVVRSGEWTGFVGILDGRSTSFSVVAVEALEAVWLPHKVAKTVFSRSPELMLTLGVPVASVLRLAFDFLLQSAGRRPMRMVAQRLVDMAGSIYAPGSAKPGQLINCNQDDIAAAVQITRPTANRILKQLAAKGLISLGYSRVDILDIDGLTALAHGNLKLSTRSKTGADAKIAETGKMHPEGLAAILNSDGWFSALPKDTRTGLINQMRISSYPTGATVFQHGMAAQGLYVFLSGQGRAIGVAPDGHETLMGLHHAGSWIGHVPIVDDRPTTVTCRVSKSAQIGFVPKDEVKQLFLTCAEDAAHLLSPLTQTLRTVYRHVIESNNAGPERLVAERLLGLAGTIYASDIYASDIYASDTVPRALVENLNQADLANITGLSRPTVNKILQKMGDLGIVKLGYGRISILDAKALLRMASGQ